MVGQGHSFDDTVPNTVNNQPNTDETADANSTAQGHA